MSTQSVVRFSGPRLRSTARAIPTVGVSQTASDVGFPKADQPIIRRRSSAGRRRCVATKSRMSSRTSGRGAEAPPRHNDVTRDRESVRAPRRRRLLPTGGLRVDSVNLKLLGRHRNDHNRPRLA
ncbi:hypothetical protein EVAR_20570_1 [Eumeta japonica]|uniref:Uncharacterized protein n=1 Tax=Eumeta variegata TaxID=151549 RepID=A0A4C1URX7_EUMVA|nr:hypothetical protein EVAR_20570_1 [Eumeta japonica]